LFAKACFSLEQKGFFIPAGTPILGNHWGIHRDPVYYPDPEQFNIDRWLVKDDVGDLMLNKDMKHFQFGFGRR
jgi:cytochrome P450